MERSWLQYIKQEFIEESRELRWQGKIHRAEHSRELRWQGKIHRANIQMGHLIAFPQ
jgi:hypothetical protein